MEIWQALILGLVQGFSEFLPISSSGHLLLVRAIMGLEGTYLLFDILVHCATLLAIVIIFFKDLLGLLKPPFKTLGILVIATIPAVIVGLLLSNYVDEIFGSAKYLCFFFLISATIMLLCEVIGKRVAATKDITMKNAIAMGLLQSLAVLPGVTRSGSTIFGGVATGGKREEVAKFSFFMSLPIICGAVVLQLTDISSAVTLDWSAYVVGMLAAFASGLFAIKLMLKVIAKANYKWFALYLFVISILSFIFYFL